MKTINSKRILQICTAVVILVLTGMYFFVPSFNNKFNEIVKLFASGDIDVIKEYILSYGVYAVIVSFLLMMFQSVIAPLPAFLITFSNAGIFGWWQGAILSWSSAMAGAALCFYISRIFGRDVAEKFATKTGLKEVDVFFDKYGVHSILVARLLPFVSFDIVSYAAGLTSMRFRAFFIATGIGQLPATIVYSYVGGMLTGGAKLFVTGLLIIFALFILIFMLRLIFKDRLAGKKEQAKDVPHV
uniref:TVP38/TMEM64 family membrane protein n=1 Tax=uncultured bacterium contig00036 TaxID=1181524 RepID=A0A806KEM3_9BACT|nr:alkaline phosphatase like protein [uncultured bacterium contig00036]